MNCANNPLHREGLSQAQRRLAALDPATAPLDGRSGQQLLAFAAAYAQQTQVRFYPPDSTSADYGATWAALMAAPGQQTLDDLEKRADNPPHLALFLAFLRLFGVAQGQLNAFTQRHLDFYYRQVLRLRSQPAVPDQVHLTFELARTVADYLLPAGTGFEAGPDASQQPQLYRTETMRLLNRAGLGSLRTIDLPTAADETAADATETSLPVRYAPNAATADGVATLLPADAPDWSAFGPAQPASWPAAQVGFALAAPVLRLAEGTRTITVTLQPLDTTVLVAGPIPVRVQLSGATEWIEVPDAKLERPISHGHSGSNPDGYVLHLVLLATEPRAVVGYNAAVLDGGYDTTAPVLRVLLPTAAAYRALSGFTLDTVTVDVDVQDLRHSLMLDNDQGRLNPDKPFLPFGPVPVAGSTLYVSCAETAGKCLTGVAVGLDGWLGLPQPDLDTYYQGYTVGNTKETLRPSETLVDVALHHHEGSTPISVRLFKELTEKQVPLSVSDAPDKRQPLEVPAPEQLLTVSLRSDFGHGRYANLLSSFLLDREGKPAYQPNPPYTPTAQGLVLSYQATSGPVQPRRSSAPDFERRNARLLHQGVFGWAEEHAWLKRELAFLGKEETGIDLTPGQTRGNEGIGDGVPLGTAHLLPRLSEHGTFLLGLRDVVPQSTVAVLLQVAEGSADPARLPAEVRWSVLCRNHWYPLQDRYAPVDATDSLLTSGIVEFSFPPEVTADNTLLDKGLTWLRAELWADGQPAPADSVARLVGVHPQAVRARFADQDNAPAHYAAPLPAGSVAKPRQSIAALKAVRQPYPSFGGRAAEDEATFHTRVSERLRHKQRAVTIWDYEHLVLERFPALARVQCLNHTRFDYVGETTQLVSRAPGHVVLVAVPGPGYGYVATPLTPRVSPHTLRELAAFAGQLAGPQVQVQATSPRYEPVAVTAKVAFRAGYPPAVYLPRVQQALTALLAPWTHDATASPAFGGTVYLSEVVACLEQLPYVDFVTDVALTMTPAEGTASADPGLVTASSPDAVLTSAAAHNIKSY